MSSRVKEIYQAEVNSRNIRYLGTPAGIQAIAVATDVELLTDATAPATEYWLCGFIAGIYGAVAEATLVLSLGYGGVAGANPPAVLVITTFPITIAAEALALGPTEAPVYMLPYPIKMPAATRVAVVTAAITGTDTIDEFRILIATVVGS